MPTFDCRAVQDRVGVTSRFVSGLQGGRGDESVHGVGGIWSVRKLVFVLGNRVGAQRKNLEIKFGLVLVFSAPKNKGNKFQHSKFYQSRQRLISNLINGSDQS